MPSLAAKLLLPILLSLSLAGCFQSAQSARDEAQAAAVDDDALCQKNAGPPGSNAYAACLKNRDVLRESSRAGRDRAHRNVTEQMLNGR